jgi:anti-sigma B factor antagonist
MAEQCKGETKMAMKITRREVDGVTVLDLNGRITLGDGEVVLRETIQDLAKEGDKRILLNLGNVPYIDSTGLGELVRAYTTMRKRGAEIKLLNLTKRIHDLLDLTKLYTVFDVYEDETSAIRAFRTDEGSGSSTAGA